MFGKKLKKDVNKMCNQFCKTMIIKIKKTKTLKQKQAIYNNLI